MSPQDLMDAAALDGYGHWRFMVRVAVPLARPAVAALAVFAFLTAWNQYLWPLLVTKDDQYRTVQIGLKQLQPHQHRPGQRDVRRRRDRASIPLVDPAARVPEAAGPRSDGRCGEGLTSTWHDVHRIVRSLEPGSGARMSRLDRRMIRSRSLPSPRSVSPSGRSRWAAPERRPGRRAAARARWRR